MSAEDKDGVTRVLAVDDNREALLSLEALLSANGYLVEGASSGKETLEKVKSFRPDIVLLDVQMPAPDGYEVARIIKSDPDLMYTIVVLLTAKDDSSDVVYGLEQGADDYIKKPYQSGELLARMRAFLRLKQTYGQLRLRDAKIRELSARESGRSGFGNIIGRSRAMQEVYSLITKVADSDAPVLISGESGTGKELVASALHYNSSRRDRMFVAQNCSAFNEHLLESELFGHVKGAFTGAIRDKEGLFEVADGGTFFLDELGEMSPALQVKLLRVLQDGTFTPVGGTRMKKVDVRILAATNRDLGKMMEQGTFREDLYYRLNVVNVKLPPLRERPDDIPMLAEYFLAQYAAKRSAEPKSLSEESLRALVSYHWPGNIRQLQNEIERLVLMSGHDRVITGDLLSEQIRRGAAPPGQEESADSGLDLKRAVEMLEKRKISEALSRNGGNKSEAAKELGISRSNLISKVKEYGL